MTKQIQMISTTPLTERQSELILCVATALNGVRMDMALQDIVDICIELYNSGHPWDSIGLSVLGASIEGRLH